ncbi:MAG TPA: peptide ABC transporter substrate-binding protein [Aggregatilineaceae bacterium]|nr:peptide ABC transporter substrate-binding protein [Aggregatilineaceae bacterium]
MQSLLSRRATLIMLIPVLVVGTWTAPVAASPVHQSSAPVTLRIAMPEPGNLDPVQLSRFDPSARDLAENLFVGLTRFNPLTRQADPLVAKDWSVSADGLTWTFELRDDIPWVRFDPRTDKVVAVRSLVAGDVVYAIQRACDPLRPSPVTANLMVIKGCQAVANAPHEVINDLLIAREIGVRATGPYTLEIDLLFPLGYFPALLSTPELRPLPREAVSDTGNWTAPTTLMTDGPFVLENQDFSGMTLVRNPYWPDDYAGNVEEIEITFPGKTSAAASLAVSGSLDLARLAPVEAAAARNAYPQLFKTSDGETLTMLGFSYDRALVSDPQVRRALALSIDREALVDQFFPGQAQAAARFSPPGVIAAPAVDGAPFDPAQAQADLSAAGYADCEKAPEHLITLVPDDDPSREQVGQFITQQWPDNLGCNASLFEVKAISRTLLIELAHMSYDQENVTRSHVWLATWSADYPDANAWLNDALHCQYGYIKTGRECDDTDALMDQAAVQTDPAGRVELYSQVEQLFFGPEGSFPVIPLFISTSARLQQPWLTGVNDAGSARFDLWTVDTESQPAR